jgi:hypothetical protein
MFGAILARTKFLADLPAIGGVSSGATRSAKDRVVSRRECPNKQYRADEEDKHRPPDEGASDWPSDFRIPVIEARHQGMELVGKGVCQVVLGPDPLSKFHLSGRFDRFFRGTAFAIHETFPTDANTMLGSSFHRDRPS